MADQMEIDNLTSEVETMQIGDSLNHSTDISGTLANDCYAHHDETPSPSLELTRKFNVSISLQGDSKPTKDCELHHYIDITTCPKIIRQATDFSPGTIPWICTQKFFHNIPLPDILSIYEQTTCSTINWRAILDFAPEVITQAYIFHAYPGHTTFPRQTEINRGPSTSLEEFTARTKIWPLKREIWETVISVAFSQHHLDPSRKDSEIDRALISAEENGLFRPWQENTLSEKVDHTYHLLNPFDPILPGMTTLSDLTSMGYF